MHSDDAPLCFVLRYNLSFLIFFPGDIGGQMGLFIGASILTILELFDYLYEVKYICFNIAHHHMEPLTHIQCDVLFMEMCTVAPVLELLAYKMEFFTHFLPQGCVLCVLASVTNTVSLTTPQPISVRHTHTSQQQQQL